MHNTLTVYICTNKLYYDLIAFISLHMDAVQTSEMTKHEQTRHGSDIDSRIKTLLCGFYTTAPSG